ncbi:MAG: BMP family ABC transporter substrate-binding protein [Clostridia bacterium]|nr:BMP family ABC transporter substrate-binding protein [Clostridia bacterium]
MKKSLSLLLAAMLLMMVALTGCGGSEPAASTDQSEPAEQTEQADDTAAAPEATEEGLTVGFVYVGPIGDGGYTYAHDQGRLYVEQELGVKTLYKESVPEGPEVEKVMRDMIDQGATMIFATSFGYMDYVEKISKEFPEIKFLHCSGYKSTDNMNNYFGRMYEPRFLSGIVAGLKTETNKIGYVAAFEIPEVVRGINAFALGVQAVNPDAEVDVRWTHTWYDPAKEKEAAKALLDSGADVIAQHQDTAGPQQAAEEAGASAIGYNSISEEKAPNAYMTAPIWNWGVYYKAQIEKAMNGEWTPENYWGGMNDGVVQLAPITANGPEGAQEKVDEYATKIADGSFQVFGGVIEKQDGTTVGEEGGVLTDADLLSMNYFVKNVVGSIEQ